VVVHKSDNVATALTDLSKGQEIIVNVGDKEIKVVLLDDIPFGHKFAIKDIPEGGHVVKYGEVIGRAAKPIKAGKHAHVHNIESLRCRGDWEVNKK